MRIVFLLLLLVTLAGSAMAQSYTCQTAAAHVHAPNQDYSKITEADITVTGWTNCVITGNRVSDGLVVHLFADMGTTTGWTITNINQVAHIRYDTICSQVMFAKFPNAPVFTKP